MRIRPDAALLPSSEGRVPGSLYAWLVVISVGSGFPYGLFQKTARLHLVRLGIGTVELGLLSLLALPWTLKFIWAPLVDRFGSRRRWIVGALAALAAVALGYALLVAPLPLPATATAGEAVAAGAPSTPLPLAAAVLLAALAFVSATQDIAVDGYAVECFPGRAAGMASGVRVNAYRLAFLAAGGLLLALVASVGWSGAWITGAIVLAALAAVALMLPSPARPPQRGVPVIEPFRELMASRGFAILGVFVLLFKVGDYALAPMADVYLAKPVAEGGAGFGNADFGLVTTLGLALTVAGGLLGGWLTSRWGVFRALWILGGLQAISNLAYAGAASIGGPVAPWVAALVEPLCGGLGTAPFAALLMRSCSRRHAGTQYAILSAIFGLAREVSGSVSGIGVVRLGWAAYFGLTFLVALPAFALLPWVARWLERRESEPDSAPAAPPAE